MSGKDKLKVLKGVLLVALVALVADAGSSNSIILGFFM